ncbi:MAG: hypothetical protein WCT03_14655 [Candidatus Obscuribacterales bacterium]|jgi:hypothetical protein
MDGLFYLASALIAIFILVFIAESDRLLSFIKPKPKIVNSDCWGTYEGMQSTGIVSTLEVKPLTGKQKIIGGSTTYAAGRGVKMNGS